MGMKFVCHEHEDMQRVKYNPCFITPMTLTHFVSGFLFYLCYGILTLFNKNKDFDKNNTFVLASAIILFLISLFYEFIDFYGTIDNGSFLSNIATDFHTWWYGLTGIGELTKSGFDNSFINSFGDQLFCTFGISIAIFLGCRKFNKTNKILLGLGSLIFYIFTQQVLVKWFINQFLP